jgi:nucleotide-binding universal stress UspA family protein
VIRTILLPLLEPEDGRALAVAGDLCRHFRAHLEVVRMTEERSLDDSSFDRWRVSQGLRSARHRGLPSASSSESVDLHALESRAKLADLICLTPPPSSEPAEELIKRLVFACGRPVLIVPMADPYLPNAFLGARTVVGWNGSAEAVRATSAALPFLEVSASIEVLTLDEEAYGAADAYEIVGYLSAHGIQATAAGIGRKHWSGGDVIEIARERDPGLFVMGARRHGGSLGSATRGYLSSRPFPVLMMA